MLTTKTGMNAKKLFANGVSLTTSCARFQYTKLP